MNKDNKKILIVGGVAGGATAAARLRRLDENAEIIIFEKSGYVSYATCGMPYFLGDVIPDRESLTLQSPESFKRRFNIDVRVNHEVCHIYPDKHTVLVKDLKTGNEFEESYDKLILSPGARPVKPEIPGIDADGIFTLRTVEDAFTIKDFVEKNTPRSVAISGGGFIGLELAENFREKGMDVHIIQRSGQLMKQFDPDIATFIHKKLRDAGVQLHLNETIGEVNEVTGSLDICLKSGNVLHADMLVLAIGVEPEEGLAADCGLKQGIRGSIITDEHMRTSDPDIYAIGDAVQVKHLISGFETLIPLAGPAYKQGRIAADNICGIESAFPGSQGTSIIKLFDMTFASTGLNEKSAAAAGLDFDKVILSPADHAGYYPGGKAMTMKVIFEKGTDKLLGAQIAGYGGVDKRIDVLATAMYAGVGASQLKELDLAYAPPYSSARDPVNMAGFMIENIESGILKQFFYEDLANVTTAENVTLLDVRTPAEFSKGAVPGFVNIPVDELRERIQEIQKDRPVYVMCQSGLRSYVACRILAGHGIEAYNFAGGYRYYSFLK